MDLSTSIVDILQRVKNIFGMLETPSLEETRVFSNKQGMFEKPPILLQASHFEETEEQALFFVSLEINDLCLHNCMIESKTSVNMMSLKVVNQLGLEITGPYKDVYGFESKGIEVCGLIEGLEVHLVDYLDFPLIMNIVFIDVPDTWGILLSRKWAATLGGILQMDLSYITIPAGFQGHITLYNKTKRKEHIERHDYEYIQSNYNSIYPSSPQYWASLPFAEEDSVDEVLWPKGNGY
jgi:hypothetical protein